MLIPLPRPYDWCATRCLRLPEHIGDVRITVGVCGEFLQHALRELFPRRHLLELDFRLDGIPINFAVTQHGPDIEKQAKTQGNRTVADNRLKSLLVHAHPSADQRSSRP